MFESPADEHINALIEELCNDASRFTTSEEVRQTKINQIAQLRAAQNPIIQMTRP